MKALHAAAAAAVAADGMTDRVAEATAVAKQAAEACAELRPESAFSLQMLQLMLAHFCGLRLAPDVKHAAAVKRAAGVKHAAAADAAAAGSAAADLEPHAWAERRSASWFVCQVKQCWAWNVWFVPLLD